MPNLRALIYVADDTDDLRAQAACLTYCERQGYQVVGIVRGDRAGHAYNGSVWTMAQTGSLDVVVINRRHELPEARLPRIEFVEDSPVKPPRFGRRRPGPIDR